jgi:hypothetical protein
MSLTLTLIWGKEFKFEKIVIPTGTFDELYGVGGDKVYLRWEPVEQMMARAAEYGVPGELWPVYPDCVEDSNVPLDDARTKSALLREALALAAIPDEVLAEDFLLGLIARILRKGDSFFIMG